MGNDTRPFVLARGPARSSFITNWCKAGAEISDTKLLVMNRAEWQEPRFRELIRMRAALPNAVRSRSGRLAALEAHWLATTVKKACGRLPDLVHSHFYADAQLVTALARVRGIPHVHTEHSSALLDPSSISPRGLNLLHSTYNSAAMITVVSQTLAEAVHGIVPHADIHVVPNPIIVPDRIKRGRAERATDPSRPCTVVSVGGLIPLKRPMLALSSFKYLFKDLRFSARLSFIGDGPLRAQLEEAGRRAGLTHRIHFHGELDHENTLERIAKADVLLHCSERETFGVALAEAAACGVPVVTTPCGGVAERLGQESGFVVVDTANDERLALAMLDLVTSEPDTTELRRTVETEYSTHTVAEKLRQIYSRLLASD